MDERVIVASRQGMLEYEAESGRLRNFHSQGRWFESNPALPEVCSESFFFDGPFSRRDSFEALVRYRLAALDRAPIGSCGKARLSSVHRSQLFVQIVGQALVEFGLVELGRQVGWIHLVRRLTGVLPVQVSQRSLDPGALGS